VKILVIAPCPFPASRGSQLLIERTTAGLIGVGHEVEVLAPRFGEAGRGDPFPVLRAGLPRLGRSVESRPELARLIDDAGLLLKTLRHRPDVLLGHNVEGGLIAGLAARLIRVPAVYVRHSAFGEELGLVTRHAVAMGLGARAEQLAARLCDAVVQLAAHPWRNGATPVEVVPPPADPAERRIEPGDGRTLYYEGNLDRYQNPSWLRTALDRARREDSSVRLLLGSGPDDRPPRADLALVPRSLPGGFPMKLLAYQTAGIPAVCVESGAPGMEDGLDAFVVRGRGSEETFGRRVVEALGNPGARQLVRLRARERALARNDPALVARRLESVLVRTRMAAPGAPSYIR
jgi:glycosyltransferase involved in cell wall biosynthesis